jgi:hypothetical protein
MEGFSEVAKASRVVGYLGNETDGGGTISKCTEMNMVKVGMKAPADCDSEEWAGGRRGYCGAGPRTDSNHWPRAYESPA